MTKEELEQKVLEFEEEIDKIKKRNHRVEGDKSWETSLIRKICIIIFTYIFALLYLKVADTTNPFLGAIVPCLGFYLSIFLHYPGNLLGRSGRENKILFFKISIMKKFLLIGLLFLGAITLTGCKENSLLGRLGLFNIMDGDGMERSAEDICLSFDGQVSETEDGEAICILSDEEFCYMFDIEDGGCDLLGYEYEYEGDMPSSVYCEENGGTYQIWLEGGEEQEVCTFDDDSFCYFDDLVVGNCSKGEFYYDEDGVEEYDAIYESCLSAGEDLVCGKDGNTYFNRCMMMLEGVEEETELAEIVDGECVFG